MCQNNTLTIQSATRDNAQANMLITYSFRHFVIVLSLFVLVCDSHSQLHTHELKLIGLRFGVLRGYVCTQSNFSNVPFLIPFKLRGLITYVEMCYICIDTRRLAFRNLCTFHCLDANQLDIMITDLRFVRSFHY